MRDIAQNTLEKTTVQTVLALFLNVRLVANVCKRSSDFCIKCLILLADLYPLSALIRKDETLH